MSNGPTTDPDKLKRLREQARSFYAVRRAIGLLGIAIPISLLFYALVWPGAAGRGMQDSISAFYHTHMGDVLVGALSAVAVFLISYLGYEPKEGENRVVTDFWVSTAAGIGALGVALFPTGAPEGLCTPGQTYFDRPTEDAGNARCAIQGLFQHPEFVHLASAALFFAAISVMCLFLFPRGANGITFRRGEHRVYLVCGAILGLAALGLLLTIFGILDGPNVVFWLESVGVIAFAVAWLVKGRTTAGLRTLFTSGARSG